MNKFLVWLLLFLTQVVNAQSSEIIQARFCNSLYKIFELGINDNFESYDGTYVKQSAFLQVPAYGIHLEKFPVNYADKDHRFVAKTNLNLDSLSAIKAFEELQPFISRCLDTTWANWISQEGDDDQTVFMKELRQVKTRAKLLTLSLAIVSVAPKLYTINLYVKRT